MGRRILVLCTVVGCVAAEHTHGHSRQPFLFQTDYEQLPQTPPTSVAQSAQQAAVTSAVATFQDMADTVVSAKSRVGELLDRLSVDNDRLRQDFQAEAAQVSDLELEKRSLQATMAREKSHLQEELAMFKQHMVQKIAQLQASNRQLEEANLRLVTQSDRCSAELESEKAKKEGLVKKLQKMAAMFNRQQFTVRQIIEQQQKRVTDEVSNDVRDAVMVAGDPAGQQAQVPVMQQPLNEAQGSSMEFAAAVPLAAQQAPPMSEERATADVNAELRDTFGQAQAIAQQALQAQPIPQTAPAPQVAQATIPQPAQAPQEPRTPAAVQAPAVAQVPAVVQAPVVVPAPVAAQAAPLLKAPAVAVAPVEPAAAVPAVSQNPAEAQRASSSPHVERPRVHAHMPKMVNRGNAHAAEIPPPAVPNRRTFQAPALRKSAQAPPSVDAAEAADEEELAKAIAEPPAQGAVEQTSTMHQVPSAKKESPEDDEQLKMLRSEVAKLEQSVKTNDKDGAQPDDSDLDSLLNGV